MKRSIRKLLWVLAAVAGAGLLLLGRHLLSEDGPEGGPGRRGPGGRGMRGPVPVAVAPVVVSDITSRRAFTGTLEPVATLTLAANVSGYVESLDANLGDEVQSGQVVGRLHDDELAQALREARAALSVARANRSAAEHRLTVAAAAHTRAERLFSGGFISQAERDELRAEKLLAESSRAVATAEVARAQANVEAAATRHGYAAFSATWPESEGPRYIGSRFVESGDSVSPGAPIVSLVDLDPVKVVVLVDEFDYAALASGQTVRVYSEALAGMEFVGRVAHIAPVFDAESRQARVEFVVPNADLRLRPGMFVRAETELQAVTEAVVVPRAAILSRDGQTFVFVVEGEVARRLPVTVGVRDGDFVQLRESISGRVITLGHQNISDGAQVLVTQEMNGYGQPAVATESLTPQAPRGPGGGGKRR